MYTVIHTSAKPSHYNKESKHYDSFNEKNSALINKVLENYLSKHKVKAVLDLSCGTGSQVFYLTKYGYQVIGVDINSQMLSIAKNKAQQFKKNIMFKKGDMRTAKIGQFDAVITIFNAIGHLTKQDFEKAIQNIRANLNKKGLYIFDIFNLNYLLEKDNITRLTIDVQTRKQGVLAREIQYSTINHDGVLASYDIYHEQTDLNKPKISKAFQTLQVYSADQLKKLLEKNSFKLIKLSAIDGSRFNDKRTERMLVVAQKIE
ncbi:MAG: hypothetical protein Tsb005_08440 [Gammaproteobacteria bacterium]